MPLDIVQAERGDYASPAVQEARQGVTNPEPLSALPTGDVTPSCEACGKPIPLGARGQVRRFCDAACRKRASRGGIDAPTDGERAAAQFQRVGHFGNARDMAVSRLSYAIKAEDGLRAGVQSLVYILADESARLLAQPEYWRRQMVGRIAAACGLKLAD